MLADEIVILLSHKSIREKYMILINKQRMKDKMNNWIEYLNEINLSMASIYTYKIRRVSTEDAKNKKKILQSFLFWNLKTKI